MEASLLFLVSPIKEIAYSFISFFVHFKVILFSTQKGNAHWKHNTRKKKKYIYILLFLASLQKIPGTALGLGINVKSSCWAVHWELPTSHFLWNYVFHGKITPNL